MSAITALVKSLTDGAADGTGIVKLVPITKKLLNSDTIPTYLIDYVEGLQQAQFGSYPDSKDVAPCAVFIAIFIILFLAHSFIFIVDLQRKHYFPLSFGFAFYCLLRWLGFTLRLVWAKDIMKLHIGIASAILIVLPTVFLASFNLVLAQRIFTWRHPVYGNNKLFWAVMIAIYSIVTAVVLMTIVAAAIPYLYFLSQNHYDMCKNVVKVSCILIMLYSLLAMVLTLGAFILPTATCEKESLVFQPFWIKSFGLFYFPPKNSSYFGNQTFVKHHQGDNRHPNRTILGGNLNTIDYESNIDNNNNNNNNVPVSDITSDRDLNAFENTPTDAKFTAKHNLSIILIAITSVFVFLGALFRGIAMFLNETYSTESWICKPVVMYVMFGALETIVNLLYLIFRVDLRFYRPDKLSSENRAILNDINTGERSANYSDSNGEHATNNTVDELSVEHKNSNGDFN